MRAAAWVVLGITFVTQSIAQPNTATQMVSTDCTFEDGRQLSIQYVPGKGEEPRNGKVWDPGGSPIIFFTGAPLTLSASSVPAGAYTLRAIPGKREWMLIVNGNVTPGSSYDASKDVARGPMEIGEISEAQKQLQVSFAHMAPKVCSLRLYYGKVGASVEFKEQ